jgi:hypothetical protein
MSAVLMTAVAAMSRVATVPMTSVPRLAAAVSAVTTAVCPVTTAVTTAHGAARRSTALLMVGVCRQCQRGHQ